MVRSQDGCVTLATFLVVAAGIALPVEALRIMVHLSGPSEMSHVAFAFEAVLFVIPSLLIFSFANLYAARVCVTLPQWSRVVCLTVAILDGVFAVALIPWVSG